MRWKVSSGLVHLNMEVGRPERSKQGLLCATSGAREIKSLSLEGEPVVKFVPVSTDVPRASILVAMVIVPSHAVWLGFRRQNLGG